MMDNSTIDALLSSEKCLCKLPVAFFTVRLSYFQHCCQRDFFPQQCRHEAVVTFDNS